MKLKRLIIITTEWIGLHSWPDAPVEVGFLRNRHRHKFSCKVAIPVEHGDREKEFFIEQEKLKGFIETSIQNDDLSCEHYAEYILKFMGADYVEVWEDGENGARVEKDCPTKL